MRKALVSDDLWALVALLLRSNPLKPTGDRPGNSNRAALIVSIEKFALGFLCECPAQKWAVAAA